MIRIFLLLVITIVAVKSLSFIMTTGPLRGSDELSKKNKFFVELASDLEASVDHFPHPDYLTLTIANPYDESLTVQEVLLLDTGSDFYLISENTFNKLDLLVVGACEVGHLESKEHGKVQYKRTIVKVMLGKWSHNVFACVHGDMDIVSKLLLEKLSLVYKALHRMD